MRQRILVLRNLWFLYRNRAFIARCIKFNGGDLKVALTDDELTGVTALKEFGILMTYDHKKMREELNSLKKVLRN